MDSGDDLKILVVKRGGLMSYLGTDDAREVEEVLPEVEEMTALALGALRVLHGEIEAKEY